MVIETVAWQHEDTGMIFQCGPGIDPGERWRQLPSDAICTNCGQVHGKKMSCAIAALLQNKVLKLERWRNQVSRYLPGESDCSTCRFARIEGSICEPAGMLLEGLMMKQAESGAGCPWQEMRLADAVSVVRKVLDDAETLERFLDGKDPKVKT